METERPMGWDVVVANVAAEVEDVGSTAIAAAAVSDDVVKTLVERFEHEREHSMSKCDVLGS